MQIYSNLAMTNKRIIPKYNISMCVPKPVHTELENCFELMSLPLLIICNIAKIHSNVSRGHLHALYENSNECLCLFKIMK